MRKIFAATMLMVLFAGTKAAALNVTPMILEVDAVGGQTYTGSLDVYASPDSSETARVYMKDWDKNPDGADVDAESGTLARSCGKWMTVSPSMLDIPANGKAPVKFSFTPPADASGSYWTFIMVEGASKPTKPVEGSDKVQMMIETRLRYAVRVFVNVRGTASVSGKIENISVGPPVAGSRFSTQPLVAALTFSNSGDIVLKPQGYIEIRNMNGETISRIDVQDKYYVIPGRERMFEIPLNVAASKGEYIALAVLDYGGESLVAGETHFTLMSDIAVLENKNEKVGTSGRH